MRLPQYHTSSVEERFVESQPGDLSSFHRKVSTSARRSWRQRLRRRLLEVQTARVRAKTAHFATVTRDRVGKRKRVEHRRSSMKPLATCFVTGRSVDSHRVLCFRKLEVAACESEDHSERLPDLNRITGRTNQMNISKSSANGPGLEEQELTALKTTRLPRTRPILLLHRSGVCYQSMSATR